MDAKTVKIAADVGKVILQGYFAYMQTVGATEIEINSIYYNALVEFSTNNPSKLPDVKA